jgi:hypothetical protein
MAHLPTYGAQNAHWRAAPVEAYGRPEPASMGSVEVWSALSRHGSRPGKLAHAARGWVPAEAGGTALDRSCCPTTQVEADFRSEDTTQSELLASDAYTAVT